MKRVSSRTVVLSKAFKTVDAETRLEFAEARILKLEADNYVETETAGADDDGDYGDNEDDQRNQKKKRMKSSGSTSKNKWLARKPKSLERLVFEEIVDGGGRPNYESVAAEPSASPPVKLCSVCGYIGNYACTRCGQRFCCIKCNNNHKESRCLKFSM